MNRLSLDEIDTSAGRCYCLHLAEGLSAELASLTSQIQRLLKSRGQHLAIAKPATRDRSLANWFRQQTVGGWLARRGLTSDQTVATLKSLGVRVHPILEYNAGDPRAMLGLAAAFAEKPDVILYHCMGMSPLGRVAAHQFVKRRHQDVCCLHLSPLACRDAHDHATKPKCECLAAYQCVELVMPID